MAATTAVEQGVVALNSSYRSSFSRRSATYTASTFTAFEYGSSFQYHGMFNSDEGQEQNIKSDAIEGDHELEGVELTTNPSLGSLSSGKISKLYNNFEVGQINKIVLQDQIITPDLPKACLR